MRNYYTLLPIPARPKIFYLIKVIVLLCLMIPPGTLQARDFKEWVRARESELVKQLKRDITFAMATDEDETTYTISYEAGTSHVVEAYTVVDGIVISANRMASYQSQEMAFKVTDTMVRVYKNVGYMIYPDNNGCVLAERDGLSIRLGYFLGDNGLWIAFQEAF